MDTTMLALIGLIAMALLFDSTNAVRRAPTAADMAEDAGMSREVPLRPGAGSIIDNRTVPASREVREAERSRDAERERVEPL
jgi:hypothetical protein